MLVWSILFMSSLVLMLAIFTPFAFENSQVIYDFFSIVCHQSAQRSYFINGTQFPVCARCLGIFGGYFLAVLSYPLIFPRPKLLNIKIALFLIVPLILDGMQNFYPTPSIVRTLTGVMFSFGIVYFMLPILSKAFRKTFKG